MNKSVAFGAFMAIVSVPAVACDRPPDSAVIQAMRDMYKAAGKDDLDAFHSVTTTDFYAFEAGKRFDGDALMLMVKGIHDKGIVIEWNVTVPDVHAGCDMAWITYTNVGSLTDASGTHPVKWLESANLVPDGKHWRIRFFSSTRMP